jgi:ADP-L-glycero-D-manno-heptose 6-epimerase
MNQQIIDEININSEPDISSFNNNNINHYDFINYYKNKNIVVTGGTGFIGRNIVNDLLKYANKIIIFDRNIKYIWDNDKIIFVKGDLLNNEDINKLYSYNFDILFHQAANVDTTCVDENIMINTNFNSFKKIIELCEIKSAKLIYASSAATYGNTNCPNIVGKNEIPLNIYGKSKLMMDNFVRINKNNFKINIIGLRYFNVYGNGENHKNKMMSMISQIINNLQKNMDIDLFEFGNQKRDFIYVKDVVNCNLLAGSTNKIGIFNCGYGESVTFNKIFDIIKTYYNCNSKINYIKNNYDFFQNETLADINDSSQELGFYPNYDLIKGIYDYMIQL